MRISDWSSDVCSSDLDRQNVAGRRLSPEQSPILPVGLLVTAAVFRMSAARQQIQERNMAYYDYDYRSRSDRSRAPRGDRMSNPSSGGVYGRRRSEGEGRYGPSSRSGVGDDEARGFFARSGGGGGSRVGERKAER